MAISDKELCFLESEIEQMQELLADLPAGDTRDHLRIHVQNMMGVVATEITARVRRLIAKNQREARKQTT